MSVHCISVWTGQRSNQPGWVCSSRGSVARPLWSSTSHTWCGRPLCWRAPWPAACSTSHIGNTPRASTGPYGWAPDGEDGDDMLHRMDSMRNMWGTEPAIAPTFDSTAMGRWHSAQLFAQNLVWQRTHTGRPSLRMNLLPPRSSRQ